jgi:hypothetical protein
MDPILDGPPIGMGDSIRCAQATLRASANGQPGAPKRVRARVDRVERMELTANAAADRRAEPAALQPLNASRKASILDAVPTAAVLH